MVARLAISTNGRNGQYVGTTRVAPPTAGPGSPSARNFNGTSERIIGGRSNDLGNTYLLVMTFWRGAADILANDMVAARLFSQYSIGATRVGVGINRQSLALTYTDASGASYLVESQAKVMDLNRHFLGVWVRETEIIVYLDGVEAIRASATLAAPDAARMTFASDANARFFKGFLDDVATFQTPPAHVHDWLRYHRALTRNVPARDMVFSTFGPSAEGVTLLNGGYTAVGMSNAPLSRVGMATPFRSEPELPEQSVEFKLLAINTPTVIKIGVYNTDHNLTTHDLGTTPNSYAYTQDGKLIRDNLVVTSALPTWNTANVMAMRWEAATGKIYLIRDGVDVHNFTPAAGAWTAAVTLGNNQVSVNAGQAWPYSLPLDTPGLPSKPYSRLTTEYREMKLGEVCAPLDDADSTLRDAYTDTPVGLYLGTPQLVAGFTEDSLDQARKVGGGVKVNYGAHTTADTDFFFAIAYQPSAADLVGEKVILESPGSWGLKMLDGRLLAWVGSVQAGSIEVAFDADGRYLIGMTRSASGKLLVWSHIGYILQSGDVTTAQTQADVWVGSAADGSKALTGKFSHLLLSAAKPANWKLERLRHTYDWDVPNIAGAIPNPPVIRKVFEPSWRDVMKTGIDTTPGALDCYVAALAVAPDPMAIEYRMVSRKNTDSFAGTQIKPWTAQGLLTAVLSKHATSVQLADFTDLTGVTVGSAALIDDEIVRVTSINHSTGLVGIARGCVDTVPTAHGTGSRMWFYDATVNSTSTLYVLNDKVDVRLLSGNGLTELEVDLAPNDQVTMAGRLNRPYPPADVKVNDEYEPTSLAGTVQVKWKHRNKATQGDSLVDWGAASVTAATALTYVVRVYTRADAVLLHESTPQSSTTDTYDLLIEYTGEIVVSVTSYQSSVPCWQIPEIGFDYTNEVLVLMATEEGEAFENEDEQSFVETETLTSLKAASYSGQLPDDYDWMGAEAGEFDPDAPILGVKISEMPNYTAPLAGPEHLPIIVNDTNYKLTMTQLLAFITANIPEAQDGKSAYEIWLDNGHTGSEAQFLASLVGPAGPASNQSRRIQTISSGSGAIICNWALYDEIRIRMTGPVILNFQGAVNGQGCILKLQQDATGGRTVTLPNTVRYNAFTAFGYTATPTPNLVDRVAFTYDSADGYYDLNALAPGYFTGP